MLALFTPIAIAFRDRVSSNGRYFSILACLYVVYELVLAISEPIIPEAISQFMNLVVFVIVPFAILYLYGLKLPELSNRQVAKVAVGSGLIFLTIAIFYALPQHDFVHTQAYKYPPTIYYLSYAFCALNVVYLVCRNYLSRFPSSALVWLSANSLWVYLWHILAVYLWRFALGSADGYLPLVVAKAAFLLGFGVCATLLQNAVFARLQRRTVERDAAEGASSINRVS